MPSKSRPGQSPPATRAALPVLLTLALVGCSGRGVSLRGHGPELTTQDFRAGPEAEPVALAATENVEIAPAASPSEPVAAPTPAPYRTLSIGPSLVANPLAAPDDSVTQAYLTASGAPEPDPGAQPVSSPTLIDAKIGDINGKPIYADEFFEPLEAAFTAEAAKLPRATWLRFVRDTIAQTVDGIITDELLRAEALARLSPEQQQGLRAWLAKSRERIIGNNLGSEKLAEEQARSERGKSLNQLVDEERQSVLISFEIRESINQRVNVSWRDVRQQYLRDYNEWNKDPLATFRLIRVSSSDTDTVASINERLAAGEDFESLASEDLNGFNPDTGGIQAVPLKGDYATSTPFGPEPLNEAARGLKPGEWAGPIEWSGLTGWVRLESIEERSTSLYDAQLAIETQLLSQRRRAELDRYVTRLVDRARVNNREQIIEALFDIAVDRYGPGG